MDFDVRIDQEKSVLRYVLPFYLNTALGQGDGFELYQKACACFDKDENWLRDDMQHVQEDLYAHILQQYANEDPYALGHSWKYAPLQGKMRINCQFVPPKGEMIPLAVTDAGVILFASGVGFLWYEICFRDSKRAYTARELLLLQNKIKEQGHGMSCIVSDDLARYNPNMVDKKAKYIPVTNWEALKHTSNSDGLGVKVSLAQKNRACTLDAQLLQEIITANGLSWEIRQNTTEPKLAAVCIELANGTTEYRLYPVQPLSGKLMGAMPSGMQHMVACFAKVTRQHTDTYGCSTTVSVPDKALPFCYIQSDESDPEALKQLACLFSKGYHADYQLPQSMWAASFELLGGVHSYASCEGCACVHQNAKNSAEFLTVGIQNRFRNAYFILYLMVLHQHYGLLNYARRIAVELSARPKDYLDDERMGFGLDRLLLEINTFLMKSEVSSVSYIQHHNVFYTRLREQINIAEDVRSLKDGLDALTEIQQNYHDKQKNLAERKEAQEEGKRDKLIQQALGWLSALTLASALGDSYATIDGAFTLFSDIKQNGINAGNLLSTLLTGAAWIVVGVIGMKALRILFKKEKKCDE